MNKDNHKELQDKLLHTEGTKKCIDNELNNIKPEIKQMQTEKVNIYRWVGVMCSI